MSNRAPKCGDAFQTDQKLEQRYDKEDALGLPAKIIEWINEVLANEPNFEPCATAVFQDVQDFLKDGVILCKLINKLLSEAGMDTIKYKSNAKMQFVKMANVEGFNKAAERYGVPQESLFQTCDVIEGRKGPMVNVLNCISKLGFVANAKGYEPKFQPPAPPKADW